MKTFRSIFVFSSLLFAFASNQNLFSKDFENVSPSQKPTLETVCSSLSSHKIMKGDFTQEKTISKAGRTLRSSGTFIFCDEGIVWNTQKPFPSVMAVTLTKVIQTRADGKQTVTDASQNQVFSGIAKSLSAMFSGNKEELESNFYTEFSIDSSNPSKWNIHLTPKDKNVAMILGTIDVFGEISSSKIDGIVMAEKSGDIVKYNFSNQRFPEGLTADEKNYFVIK